MEEFIKILLSLSVSGAFLFGIVFLTVRLCRNRLSHRWQYYIWLIVIARFLIPVTFSHTLVGEVFRSVEEAIETARSAGAEEDAATGDEVSTEAPERMGTGDAVEQKTPAVIGKENAGEAGTPADTGKENAGEAGTPAVIGEENAFGAGTLPFLLTALWAAGAFGLLIHKITVYQSYMQFLRKGNAEVSDPEELNLLAEAEEGLRIGRTIELYRNPLITSPIMTGFFRPRIVIPDRKMTKKELTCIFTHELVHFKYFDMFYKWLVQITICIHWFNPVVRMLGKEVSKRCELSCDEKVIGTLDAWERKEYGDTLLSFLKRGENYQNPLASITLTEGAEQLIERLGAIMDYQKKSKTVIALTMALTALLCFFFSGIGAYAGAYAGQRGPVPENNPAAQEHSGLKEAVQISEEEAQTLQNAEWKDDDYRLLYDENANTYYILTEGASIGDRPTGGATGGFGIVLVKKSGYTTFRFGYPSILFNFMNELESQCQDAVDQGWISESEAALVRKAGVTAAVFEGILSEDKAAGLEADYKDVQIEVKAEDPVDERQEDGEEASGKADDVNDHYSYYQRTSYEEPYLIEYGWNLPKEDAEFGVHTEILLEDQNRMSVCFSHEAEEWLEDAGAMAAITNLLGEIKKTARSRFGLELERPYIVRIIYLPPEEIGDFAREAFEEERIADFSAVVELLPEEEKRAYCEKSYTEDKIGLFSIIISEMGTDYVADFLERCYENDDIDFFSIAAGELSDAERRALMKRAKEDKRDDFYYMLKNG